MSVMLLFSVDVVVTGPSGLESQIIHYMGLHGKSVTEDKLDGNGTG